jgi:hypothetical protein
MCELQWQLQSTFLDFSPLIYSNSCLTCIASVAACKSIIYMNLEATRLRGRPRNKRQDEVTEDGRLVGAKGWKERVYNRGEWKKLLRTARNHRILHMSMVLLPSVFTKSKISSEFNTFHCSHTGKLICLRTITYFYIIQFHTTQCALYVQLYKIFLWWYTKFFLDNDQLDTHLLYLTIHLL